MLDYIGWEYKDGHPMDPVLTGQQRTYTEAIRGDLASGELNKYGGMALSAPGYFVQIGIKSYYHYGYSKSFLVLKYY